MDESSSTGFMKKVIIAIVVIVIVVGIGVTVFGNAEASGECSIETEKVSPVDIDAEQSPF